MNGHEFLEAVFMRMSLPRTWRAERLYITTGDVNENWIEVFMANGEKWIIRAEKTRGANAENCTNARF